VLAWAPFALRTAKRLAGERAIDCVITSSPPESAHLVGRALQRRGMPWLADIRDAWNFEPLRPAFPTGLQRWLDLRLERRWLGSADAVIVVSRPAADDMRSRLGIDPLLVPNAWDPDLDPASELTEGNETASAFLDPDRTSLLYTGRFGSYGRDPSGVVRAIRELGTEEPRAAERLELVVAGPVTGDERELLGIDVSPAEIKLLGAIPRSSAIALQRDADALLLLADPRRSQLANYKLFEYLAAGRPILALAAGTEAGRIVGEIGAGAVVASNDVVAIKRALRRLAAGDLDPPDAARARAYSYPAAAQRMAEAVETAIRPSPRQPTR
jgi:glycosyltransferase involved in cell wall biosynthesis